MFSALFLASARYFIHLSRTGYRVETPLVSVLAVALFLHVWYEGGLGAAFGAASRSVSASRPTSPVGSYPSPSQRRFFYGWSTATGVSRRLAPATLESSF